MPLSLQLAAAASGLLLAALLVATSYGVLSMIGWMLVALLCLSALILLPLAALSSTAVWCVARYAARHRSPAAPGATNEGRS